MPGERRNLRSNKESSSSTNGEKARSNSTGSGSNKDKPVPTRATSSKSKALPSKKPSPKDTAGDKPQTNGNEAVENGINGVEDVDMVDDGSEKVKVGEEEMTVVVPPPKSSKLSGESGKDGEGDTAMGNADNTQSASSEAHVDPKIKAVTGQSTSMQSSRSRTHFLCNVVVANNISKRYQSQLHLIRTGCSSV